MLHGVYSTIWHKKTAKLAELARSVEAKRLIPIHTDSPLAAPETAAAFLLDQPPQSVEALGRLIGLRSLFASNIDMISA
jgi:hypothetical protein